MNTEQEFYTAVCDIFDERRGFIRKLVKRACVDGQAPDDFPIRLAIDRSIEGFPEFDFLQRSDILITLTRRKSNRPPNFDTAIWLPSVEQIREIFHTFRKQDSKKDSKT